ncbi:MAG: hypothetical protein KC996_08160, partial [Phycisphaerales bacterium]|nr:hypothetical protein [Phycisphaerales bacterium]
EHRSTSSPMTAILTALVVLGMMYLILQGILKPQWALLLVLSFLPLEQLLGSYLPLLARKSWITNVAVGLVAMFALGIEFLRGQKPMRGYFNTTWLLVFFLYVFTAFGIFWSPIPEAGKYFLRTGFPYYMLLLVILPGLIRDLENIRRFVVPFMVIGSAIIFFILNSPRTEIYAGRLFVDLSYSTGSSSDRASPLTTAELGGAILIVAALFKPSRFPKPILVLRIASIFAGMGIMVLSGTRGQLLFAVALSVAFFPVAYRIKSAAQFFLTSGAVGMMCGLFYLAIKVFFVSGESNDRWSAAGLSQGMSSRMYYATTMLGEYVGNPGALLGGLGSGAFNAYVDENSENFLYPHNLVIEVLTEHGLIGLGLLMGIFLTTGLAALRLFKHYREDPVYRPVLAILFALCAYVTLISLKQGSYALIPLPFYWYLVLAKIDNRVQSGTHTEYQGYEDLDSAEYGDGEYVSR